MTIRLTPELEEMRAVLRRFTTNELEPWARKIDETGEIPEEVTALLSRKRLSRHAHRRRARRRRAGARPLLPRAGGIQPVAPRVHDGRDRSSGNTPLALVRFGTAAQQRRYSEGARARHPALRVRADRARSGLRFRRHQDRATRVDGGWVLDGRKHFINGAHLADVVMVMAVTDPARRARGGITAFLVDRGTPGFAVTRLDTTIGSEAIKLAELTFEGCRVPDSAVLGEVGQGFRIAMESLTEGRLTIACSCIGTADRLLEMATAHALSRSTFGRPLAERQAIQWMLADSATELAAARALTYATVLDVEAGIDTGSRPSMCKLLASEMVGRVADRSVQIHGGMGVIRGFPVERFYRGHPSLPHRRGILGDPAHADRARSSRKVQDMILVFNFRALPCTLQGGIERHVSVAKLVLICF
jgi:acyl-CoA dehydrogenase